VIAYDCHLQMSSARSFPGLEVVGKMLLCRAVPKGRKWVDINCLNGKSGEIEDDGHKRALADVGGHLSPYPVVDTAL
jgi:hypothetical protein